MNDLISALPVRRTAVLRLINPDVRRVFFRVTEDFTPNLSDYLLAAILPTSDLEEVFRLCQHDMHDGQPWYKQPGLQLLMPLPPARGTEEHDHFMLSAQFYAYTSLSVGDIAIIEGDNALYVCDSFGWKRFELAPEDRNITAAKVFPVFPLQAE